MKHLNLELEKLEQRIAPGLVPLAGDVPGDSGGTKGSGSKGASVSHSVSKSGSKGASVSHSKSKSGGSKSSGSKSASGSKGSTGSKSC